MAMFESETGASSGDDFTALQHVEDQPGLEEKESEDPTVKVRRSHVECNRCSVSSSRFLLP